VALRNLLGPIPTATLVLMPPLSLLFSSDEETSRVLIQALRELEFEVEHCPEIFTAVQRLTNRKLDAVVADWDDGLEASFLLKTARELKSNREAFTVALVSTQEAEIAARNIGADCILTKPLSVEQVKYALLANETFLAHMREWLPKILAEDEKRSRNASPKSSPSSPEIPRSPRVSGEQSRHSAKNMTAGTGSAHWRHHEKSKKSGRARANRFLIAAIGTAIVSCAYVLHGPTESKFLSQAVRHTMDEVKSWSVSSASPALPEAAAIDNLHDSQASNLPFPEMPVRVTPAHHSFIVAPHEAMPEMPLGDEARGIIEELPPVPPPAIPDSLRSDTSIAHAPASIAGSTLLSALEPVNITEDLSENLLLEKVQPSYPEQAVRSGLQGSVVLQALIGRDGRIQSLKLVQGSFLLGRSAYQAVKQWRYRPYLMNGHAVQAQTFVTVDFNLPTRSSATLPSSR